MNNFYYFCFNSVKLARDLLLQFNCLNACIKSDLSKTMPEIKILADAKNGEKSHARKITLGYET